MHHYYQRVVGDFEYDMPHGGLGMAGYGSQAPDRVSGGTTVLLLLILIGGLLVAS